MDCREAIIENTLIKLDDSFTTSQQYKVESILTSELENYDVSMKSKSTEITLENFYAKNEDILNQFLSAKKLEGKSDKTIVQYKLRCGQFVQCLDKPLTEVTTFDVRCYINNYKQSRQVNNTTLNNVQCCIKSFFSWMFNEDIIYKNPCSRLGVIKKDKEVRKAFSDVDIEKMRRSCTNHRNKAVLEFFLSTGCRASEVVTAKIKDLDFNRRCIKILGKGSKERIVYLNDIALFTLKEYLNSRDDDLPYLFVSEKNRCSNEPHAITVACLEKMFRNLSKESGVKDIHPHRFRRTFATNLINNGAPIQDVSIMLGHSDIDTTMIYYASDDKSIESSYRKYER